MADRPSARDRFGTAWREQPTFRVVVVIVLALVLVWLGRLAIRPFTHAIVRDAFVDSHLINLAPQVQGEIVEVLVQEQARVERGQVLARIDPATYERQRDMRAAALLTAEQAERQSAADLALLEGEIPKRIEIAALAQDVAADEERRAGHGVQAARANLTMAREDATRFTELARSGSSTTRRMQEATRALRTAEAELGAAEQQLRAAQKGKVEAERKLELARLGGLEIEAAKLRVAERAGLAEEARRALELAALERSYADVVAPFAGVVAKKWRHLGDYAHVGEPLFSLYDPNLLYVTANVPETLLEGIAPGNEARLDVVAWDRPFHGRVLWVGAATDAKFSLIPRDVSAGEFTYVVQRVPVRIRIERDDRWPLLRPGLSVVAAISHGDGDPEWAAQALRDEARLEGLRTDAALEPAEGATVP
jgi:membrane fusion protein (multidrug efflux system)